MVEQGKEEQPPAIDGSSPTATAMSDGDTTAAMRKRDLVKDNTADAGASTKRLKSSATAAAESSGSAVPTESSGSAVPTANSGTSGASGGHLPVVVPPSDPAELRRVLREQIEFYFSDANMKFDKFFQEKIRATEGNWLNVEYILSCRNIKRLMVQSREAVIECLADSKLETKSDTTGYWVRRQEELPPLEQRPNQRSHQHKEKKGLNMTTLHNAGCICEAVACPEEASWENVKTALSGVVPEKAKVRFVSRLQSNGSCFVYVYPFDGDKDFFADEKVKIDVCGANITVKLVDTAEVAERVLKSILPAQVQSQRAKMLSRQQQNSGQAKRNLDKNEKRASKKATANRPILLAGTEFKSVQHLRQCVKECLTKTPKGSVLAEDKSAYKVINAILDYHPRGAEKKRGMVSIKVGECKEFKNHNGEPSRCFFVIKTTADGTTEDEDFSVLKCLAALEDNPPYVVDGSTPTTTGTPTCSLDAKAQQSEDSTTTPSTTADSTAVAGSSEGVPADGAVVGVNV